MDSPFSFQDSSMVFHAPLQRRQAAHTGAAPRAQLAPPCAVDAPRRFHAEYALPAERSYSPLPALPTVLRARSHLRSLPDHGLSPIMAPAPAPAYPFPGYRPLTLATNSPATKTSLGYILDESRPTVRHVRSERDDRRNGADDNYEPIATARYEAPYPYGSVARGRLISDSSNDSSSYTSSPLALPRTISRRNSPASIRPMDSAGSVGTETTKKKRKARICTTDGCTKYVVDHGLCIRHGGGKRCYIDGCDCRAQNRGLCWKHGGFTICKVDGCTKRAKSRGICWSHGGGTRCKRDDCSKIAVSNGLCWAHGGGKRCVFGKCRKPASERTNNFCNEHYAQEGDGLEEADL